MPILQQFQEEPDRRIDGGRLLVRLRGEDEYRSEDGTRVTLKPSFLEKPTARLDDGSSWQVKRTSEPIHDTGRGYFVMTWFTANRGGEEIEIRGMVAGGWKGSELELSAGKLVGVFDGAKNAWADASGRIVVRSWKAWKDSDRAKKIEEFLWLDAEYSGIDWPLVALLVCSAGDSLRLACTPPSE